jgi:ribosomal protein S18 acetylase RimI-like enzyme
MPTVNYKYLQPQDIKPERLKQIRDLIIQGDAVGKSWIRENLQKSRLIGFATNAKDGVIAVLVLKQPLDEYRKKLETYTGLDLSGFLEEGYITVKKEYRNRGIGGILVKGLKARSKDLKVYLTVRTTNIPALHLAKKTGLRYAVEFMNPGTGHHIGIYTNQEVKK